MKRLLTSAAFWVCSLLTTFAQFIGSGTGTEDDPYIILNADQFYSIRNFQNSSVYFSVLADIDLSDYSYGTGWEPIPIFKGVLDGNGHTIKGLVIKKESKDYVGLFEKTSRATIKNITVHGNVKGNNYVGGIVGYSGSSHDEVEYENVHFTGTIEGKQYIGGIAGFDRPNEGYTSTGPGLDYSNCSFTGSISGEDYVGGIVGYGASKISNCEVDAKISANKYVGGISGDINGGSKNSPIVDCYASVKINTTGGFVGGISGNGTGSDIIRCAVSGSIIAKGDKVGGIIGYAQCYSGQYHDFKISDNYFNGYISANEYVGGIVGYNGGDVWLSKYGGFYGYVRVNNNYAKADIEGYDKVGGILSGYTFSNNPLVESNVCICTSIKSEGNNIGRIQSIAGATPKNCYSLYSTKVIIGGVMLGESDIQSNTSLHGTDIDERNIKIATFYQGLSWDFGSTWSIQNTECLPYLQTQTAPPIIQSNLTSGDNSISGNSISGGTVKITIEDLELITSVENNEWQIDVPELQSGVKITAKAIADNLHPSYITERYVSYLGTGIQTEPYLVKTYSDLKHIYAGGYYKLVNDIDLARDIAEGALSEGWQPISVSADAVINIDGDNHTISNLFVSREDDFTGLFASLTGATIKNLIIKTASGKSVCGIDNVGILAGRLNNCTIENVSLYGKVSGKYNVGGLTGQLNGGSIRNINVFASSVIGKNRIGGIAGTSSAETTLCKFKGDIIDNVEDNDGIVNGTIVYAGGLFAVSEGDINQSTSEGQISIARKDSKAGGFVGDNYATISNSFSTISVECDMYSAGIAADNHANIFNCYASGNITTLNTSAKTFACGLVGYNDGADAMISNCAAMNEYIVSHSDVGNVFRVIGGFKNGSVAPQLNNYALDNMLLSVNGISRKVNDDIMNGTAKTLQELQQRVTYTTLGWDFETIWEIDEGTSYPYLTSIADGNSEPVNPDDPQGEIEVTDISTMSNVIYIEPMEEMCGTQATLSLKMKNTAAIRGFQFDLYLPEGVTVVKSSKGKIQGFLSEGRLPDEDEHSLTFSEQADGAIRFLCSSQYNETFTGNDGEIATLRVNIADGMADGDYLLQMKNMKLTETDISKYYETAVVNSKLTIKSYTLGDINSDGTVDVSDYTGVANHIHGDTPQGFVAKAGDVDESGTIDVSDYTGIANIIHTGNIYGNSGSREISRSPKKVNTDISGNDNVIYIEPFAVAPGTQTAISVKMKNTAAIRGFQFDLYLPEGMTAVKSAKGRIQGALNASRLPEDDEHDLTFSEQQDGAIRFLCSSQYDETFTGNDGEIATLQVAVAENMTANDYPIVLRNIKLTETDISKFYTTEELETTVTVNSAGDERLLLDEAATDAPDNATGADVRVVRTIAAGNWSTICLPFAMTEEQVKAAFGNGVQLGDFTSWSPVKESESVVGINVGFTTVTAIEANHPYIIKVEEPVTEFTVDGVNIAASAEPKVQVGTKASERGYMYGTYMATTVPEENVFLSGNKFYYSVGDSPIKAFRAYFEFRDVLDAYYDVAEARITFSLDGNTLDATLVNSERQRVGALAGMGVNSRVYNLNGQRVNVPTKGVYVKNGKKMVIK